MKVLLDTHVFLWWLQDSKKLKGEIRDIIACPENEIRVSVAVCWEISTKRKLGKLIFNGDPHHEIQKNGFLPIPLDCRHVRELDQLPDIHKDPFDRIMIAQARTMGMHLLTDDEKVRAYTVNTIAC